MDSTQLFDSTYTAPPATQFSQIVVFTTIIVTVTRPPTTTDTLFLDPSDTVDFTQSSFTALTSVGPFSTIVSTTNIFTSSVVPSFAPLVTYAQTLRYCADQDAICTVGPFSLAYFGYVDHIATSTYLASTTVSADFKCELVADGGGPFASDPRPRTAKTCYLGSTPTLVSPRVPNEGGEVPFPICLSETGCGFFPFPIQGEPIPIEGGPIQVGPIPIIPIGFNPRPVIPVFGQGENPAKRQAAENLASPQSLQCAIITSVSTITVYVTPTIFGKASTTLARAIYPTVQVVTTDLETISSTEQVYASTTNIVYLTATRTDTITLTVTEPAPTSLVEFISIIATTVFTTPATTTTTIIEKSPCSRANSFYFRVDLRDQGPSGTVLEIDGNVRFQYGKPQDGTLFQLIGDQLLVQTTDSTTERRVLATGPAEDDGCSTIYTSRTPSNERLSCQISQALGDILVCSRSAGAPPEPITFGYDKFRIGNCDKQITLTQVCSGISGTTNAQAIPCGQNNIQVFSDQGFTKKIGFLSQQMDSQNRYSIIAEDQFNSLSVYAVSENIGGFSLLISGAPASHAYLGGKVGSLNSAFGKDFSSSSGNYADLFQTPENAGPATYSAQLAGNPGFIESGIWTYTGVNSRQLNPVWVNSDKNVVSASIALASQNDMTELVLTGNVGTFGTLMPNSAIRQLYFKLVPAFSFTKNTCTTANAELHQSCTADTECKSGSCDSATNTCLTALDGSCLTDADCSTPLHCSSSTCQPRVPDTSCDNSGLRYGYFPTTTNQFGPAVLLEL